MINHSTCDFGWTPVRCDRCGREFICTPSDDLYCAVEGDHCCESCLIGHRELRIVDPASGDVA